MVRKKKGQSTLEYILLVTAVVAVLIIFLRPGAGPFSQALNNTYGQMTGGMESMANRLSNSYTP